MINHTIYYRGRVAGMAGRRNPNPQGLHPLWDAYIELGRVEVSSAIQSYFPSPPIHSELVENSKFCIVHTSGIICHASVMATASAQVDRAVAITSSTLFVREVTFERRREVRVNHWRGTSRHWRSLVCCGMILSLWEVITGMDLTTWLPPRLPRL